MVVGGGVGEWGVGMVGEWGCWVDYLVEGKLDVGKKAIYLSKDMCDPP